MRNQKSPDFNVSKVVEYLRSIGAAKKVFIADYEHKHTSDPKFSEYYG
jgi:hypothetical protein